MLAEILSAVEKLIFSRVCLYVFFFFTFVFICFSFCLSRVFYVHVVCSWCAHVCSWCAHVYGECNYLIHIVFACWLKYCLRLKKLIFSRVWLYVFFSLRLYLFVFRSVCRVCFTCMLYKVYVLGVRMYVLGVRMFMMSVAACLTLFLHAD